MPIQIQGNGLTVAEVEAAFRALRTTVRPLDHGVLGHYRLATTAPLAVTQAANGTLFSFRWTDATRFAVLQKLRLSVLQTSAATATIMPTFQAFIARGFTASDSAGTAISLAGNTMKKRTNMGTSLVADVRKTAVAAGLTVGTRTLDAEPIMELGTNQTITTPNAILYERELEVDMGSGQHPYVFTTNEGLIVRGPTVVFGAAGTANLFVDMSWVEVAAF